MRTPATGTPVLLGLVAAVATTPVALADAATTGTTPAEPVTAEPSATEPAEATPTTEPTSSYPPPSPEIFITGDGRPQPGDEIGVVVRCPFEPRKPTSPVLTIGEYEQVESPSGMKTHVAPATVDPSTAPGDYPVTAWCGRGAMLTWTFTVYPADPTGGGGTPPAAHQPSGTTGSEERQVTRIPKGAPETGGPESADAQPVWTSGLAADGFGAIALPRPADR